MKNKQILKGKISQKAFDALLEKNPKEDITLINTIESYFIKKRGYVIHMPTRDTPVILLFSGGLDSTVACAFLIEQYNLVIYPVSVVDPNNKGAQRAIHYFANYFKKRYPSRFHEPKIFTNSLLPQDIQQEIFQIKNLHPQHILDRFDINTNEVISFMGINAFTPLYGILYGEYLKRLFNIHIHHFFLGVLATDGLLVKTQTLTYLRKTMLFLDQVFDEESTQVCSIFFEKTIHHAFTKKDIILLGQTLALPLEKTYSCYRRTLVHCGTCLACRTRKYEFEKGGINDKTIYLDKIFSIQNAKNAIKNILSFRIKID